MPAFSPRLPPRALSERAAANFMTLSKGKYLFLARSGVHLATNLKDVKRIAGSMLGERLVTKQSVGNKCVEVWTLEAVLFNVCARGCRFALPLLEDRWCLPIVGGQRYHLQQDPAGGAYVLPQGDVLVHHVSSSWAMLANTCFPQASLLALTL